MSRCVADVAGGENSFQLTVAGKSWKWRSVFRYESYIFHSGELEESRLSLCFTLIFPGVVPVRGAGRRHFPCKCRDMTNTCGSSAKMHCGENTSPASRRLPRGAPIFTTPTGINFTQNRVYSPSQIMFSFFPPRVPSPCSGTTGGLYFERGGFEVYFSNLWAIFLQMPSTYFNSSPFEWY